METYENHFFSTIAPKKFSHVSLESCDKQPKNYIDFAKGWAKNPCSVFLCGDYGTGKTHFAFAMIREMFYTCQKPLWPRYYSSPKLDSHLLASIKSESGDRYDIEKIASAELLFIDDIGRETKSERIKRQYFEILNSRYVNELPTILTSNFSIDELGEVIDGAIASRIQEWQIIEFNGVDLRKAQEIKIIDPFIMVK